MPDESRAIWSLSMDVPRLLLKYALDRGVDPLDICRSIGLDPASLRNPESRISIEKFNALWEAVAHRTEDSLLGLHFGEALPDLFRGHLLFAVMMNCATLGEALERLCRYHGLLVDGAAPQVWDEDEYRVFALDRLEQLGPAYGEAVLAMLCGAVGRLTDNQVRPVQVRLAHPQPAHTAEYERIFAAPLVFNQLHDRLLFHRNALKTSIFLANPAFLAGLDQIANRLLAQLPSTGVWTRRVSETVGNLILKGEKPRLSSAAHALITSSRSLQNKLQAEGTTYQQLLDEVRQQIAKDCLKQEGIALSEVAFLVGFSEQSAFNHAFKRWTGMTPSEYFEN